jgi:hypothetical protein
MSDNLKAHIVSILTTFVSTAVFFMAVEVSSPDFVFSKDTLAVLGASALIAGVRQVAKLIVTYYQGTNI